MHFLIMITDCACSYLQIHAICNGRALSHVSIQKEHVKETVSSATSIEYICFVIICFSTTSFLVDIVDEQYPQGMLMTVFFLV